MGKSVNTRPIKALTIIMNAIKINALKTHYYQLLSLFAIDKQDIEQYWQALCCLYQQPHRFYHNLSHIDAMLDKFLDIQARIDDKSAVLFAIFYHDCIYHTPKKSQSNEQLSADYFYQHFHGLLPDDLVKKVCCFILATERHQLLLQDSDLAYFLDLDLSILAEDHTIYQHYCQNIQKEYAHIHPLLYKMGRAKMLSQFLLKKRIFYSDYFFRHETTARNNLKNELKNLRLD